MANIRQGPRRLLGATGLVLLGVTAACTSSTSAAARIPPRTGSFSAIPAPCSLINAKTLTALGLSTRAGPEPTQRETGVTEKTCSWGFGPPGDFDRSLLVQVSLFTAGIGQAPAAAAQSGYQRITSDQSQADKERGHSVPGLANDAFINHVTRGGLTQSQVQIRDQNVLVAVDYVGAASSGGPLSLSAADSGALTAARAALSALAAS